MNAIHSNNRPLASRRSGDRRAVIRSGFTPMVRELSVAFVLTFGVGAPFAWAAPQGGQVVAGAAGIARNGPLTTIQQQSQRAIVNWQSFGVNAGETVRFAQPATNAAILNRVTGALPSNINGLVQGNGKVFLVNPNGIVVGANGVINVQGGFVASTQNLSDTAFMQGGALTLSGGTDGSIQILGKISAPDGDITIVAPKVAVGSGAALEAGRAVQLIAASTVTLSNGQFTVIPQAGDAGELTVDGVVSAANAQLAAANNNLGALAINTSGTVRATGTQTNPDGSVSIVAQGAGGNVKVGGTVAARHADGTGGSIVVSGANVSATGATLDASGTQGGNVSIASDTTQGTTLVSDSTVTATGSSGAGGLVRITGRNTGLTGSTTVDASGTMAGGTVLVGGGFHGADDRIANATATTVGSGVVLNANGTQGDAKGGDVVVWSNDVTRFAGTINATGSGRGAGGNAEVSGAGTLDYRGFADLAGGASGGAFGTLLLDPTDVTIQAAGPDSGATWSGGAANFSSSTGSSVITTATLQSQLAAANVTIDTHGTPGSGNGDINVNSAVAIPDSRSLTLKAAGDINLNADVTTNSTGSLTSFNAYANRNINVNGVTLGGTSGLSSVTLVSGLGTYGGTAQDTPNTSSTAAWLPSYAGVVNFGAGSTLDTTRGLTVITGCSVACPAYAADTALTLANSTGLPPDLTINGAAAAGNVTISNTDQGAVYFGGFRDITVAGQVGSGGGLFLYGLRDIAINAPLQMTGWDWLKSERDVYLNADATGTQLLQVDAARDIHVSTSVLESSGGFGIRLWAGQRDTTATDLAIGAGSLYKVGAIYFNGNGAGGATHLESDANIETLSGCKTAVNCLPTDRTDFLPANVVLEKPTGATFSNIVVQGFHDTTPERLDPATNAYASDITATGQVNFLAFGNLTLDQTVLAAGTNLYLEAAGGSYADPSPRSGATLADYAGLVKFTQYGINPITLSATGDLVVISGTDGTGTALGAAGGTLPSGGAYSGSRTNQARPDFNDASTPNNITLKYGSSANAFGGNVIIQGFRQTLLSLDNFDGTSASSLTTLGSVNVLAYGDVILPTQMQYVRALGGGSSVFIQAGGGGPTSGLVGQVIFTNPDPVIQSDNWVWVQSSVDTTGKYLDFRGGNGTLTGGYGTGQPVLLQYAPGESSFGVVGISGFQNADIYTFASSAAAPSVASFDPSVAFTLRAGSPANSFIRVAKDLTLHDATFSASAGSGLDLAAGMCWWSCSNNNDGVLTFSAPAATFTGWWGGLSLSNNTSGRATTTTNPNGTDLTNVTFTNIGKLPTTPLTASIGGSTVTLNAPVTPLLNYLYIDGFRNVNLKTGSSTEPLSVTNLNILPNGSSIQGDINIDANVYASNQVYLTGSSINTGSNIIGSLAPANSSYDARFFATGLSTVWGEAAQNSTINTSSKNNNKSGGMQIGNAAAGTTMTINDRDSVVIGNFGATTDQGNIVVNAQGDIGVNGDIVRTGATNPASITLNADKNLSSIFTGYDAYDQGTVSAAVQAQNVAGGDGVGVTYFLAPVERVVPIYKEVLLLSLQSTNPAGTDYVAPTDPGWNAAKTQYTVSSSSPAGLLFYFPVGTVVTPGQTILTTGFNVNVAVMANYARAVTSGGQQVYVVTGYTTSTAAQPQMTSLGFGVNTVSGTVNNGATGTTLTTTLNRTSFGVSGDNPVVDALVTPTGDPVTGTYALGVAQQFYVAAGGNSVYPDASWNVRVTGPVTVQTQLGNIVVKSGSTYADTYQGFHTAGDTADVRLSSNVPAAGQGLGHPENMQQNLVTKTVNGNVLIAGYRDITVLDSNTVQPTGTGTISLIAGRDLLLDDNIGVAGSSGTLTLGAGNMIEQAAGKTITANNLVLVTGRGTNNLNTDVNNLAGYLQMPSAAYTGALSGGTTATGTIEVTNDKTLNVSSGIPANAVAGAVTFTTNGPVFDSTTMLQPVGLSTTTLGGAITGSIELTTTAGDINVAAPVTTTNTGGEINIRSDAGNVALGANVTTTGNAFIEANQAITDTAGTLTANAAVLTAGTTIGTAANPVNTAVNTLALVAGGNVYDTNAGALTVAGQTTNNGSLNVQSTGGTMTVGSVSLAPTILNNAPGATITGINASGSGAVNLTATGTTSDIVFDATARSGTGTVTATAGQNLVNGLADLVPGADTSSSANLDVATGGNVVLNAGNTIGGDGVSTIDPLSVWSGGTISATSAGTAAASGTYLDVLDTTGAVTLGGSSVQVNSAHNVDVTSVASTTANTGNLVVAGPVNAQNAGYVRLAADRNETVSGPVSTTGAGNVVLTAGLTGTGSVTQTAGGTLSTGTGEINVKAANGITFGANATTGGNIVVQAGDAIAQTGGTLAASGIALEAGTTIGAAGSPINTAASTLALSSSGDQYVSNTGNSTLGAQTGSNGSINVTNAGVLTVGSASVLTGIAVPGLTGGITTVAPGVAVTGVTANGSGNVNLAATGATGDIVTTQPVSSGTGNIAMTAARNVTDTATGSVSTGGSGTIGVTAQTGSITMADGASYTTAGGNITATAANNIALAQATTGSNTVGTVTLTAANGAISNNRTAGANNVTTGTLNATAATGIGSGTLDSSTALTTDIATLGTKVTGVGDVVIDNTNASLLTLGNGTLTNSAANGNVRVATAGAVTTGNSVSASNTVQLVAGDVNGVLTNDVGAVTLSNNVTANTLDINAGGLVTQTGGVIAAGTTLVDATRYTSGSDATLTNGSGTLTENGSSVTGNYTITTAGTLNQTGNTTVGGNLTESGYTGGTVSGTVTVGGNYNGVNTFSGSGSVTTGGSNSTINANSATTGVVVASGAGPNFDLSSANLGNSTNITVDLRGQSATVTGNTPSILLNGATGGSNSLGTVTVKTAKPVTVAVTQQDYNLTQSAAIDIGAHTLTVNAVAGSASSASLQASPGTLTLPGQSTSIDYNAANNTLNGGNGSRIVLNNTGNAIGGLTILNGESANVVTSGTLALGNVTVNNGLSATSTTGAITQTAGTSVAARTLDLTAVNGIGTAATPIAFNTVAATAAGATPVLATSDGSGSTSVATTGQVQLGGQVYQPTDTSSTTAATLTSAANGTTGGNLTVLAAGPVTTGATVTTGGNGAIDVGTTVGSVTLSNMVTAGGSGSIELTAATGIAVNAAVSSTSGEINALAQGGDVALGANVSTTGNAFVQASGAIAQSAGTLTADGAVLTAGTTIGSSANAIDTSVNTLALVSAGDAYASNDKALTAAAQTSANGNVGITTTSGDLTIGSVSLTPGVVNNAVGANLSGVTANGTGTVELAAAANLNIDAAVSSTSGEINARAYGGDVALGANVSTTGNAFVQASGAITQSAGTLTADGAVLTAGTTIGSSANAIDTSVNTLALVSAGDAYASNDKALTAAAQTSANGNVGITTTSGDLTIGSVSLTPGVVNNAVGANLSGVTANGTGTVELAAAANLNVDAAVSSTSGEINARAYGGDVALGANVSTTGNAFVQASGAITQSAGTLTADGAVLTAGTTIGSSANAIDTSVNTLALVSAGDAYASNDKALTAAAQTSANGNVGITTTSGDLTIGSVSLTPGIANNAVGANLSGVTANGTGTVELAAAANLNVDAAVSSTSGEINARAYGGDVALGANVSTTGNAFVQASGAITQSAGTLTADGAVLTAGTTIGSSANAIDTSVNTLALVSAGDAYASNDKALTAAAQTSANGNVGITTTSGDLTIGSVSLTPGVVNNAVGANLSGVTANGTGNVTLTAAGTGSNVVLDQSVTSGSGTITASATQDIVFENAAQIATTGAAVLTAGGNITNATDNTAVQIQAASATLTAGTNIGSGVIDNGITGSTNASELHLNVASLQANAGGDATLWNQGATLLQTSGAGGYFGLNGGGPIAQASGATLSAGSAEFDTTRDTSVGQVSLQNQGDLSIAAANYVGGDYTATSQSGNVTLASGAALNVNGNVTLSSGAGKTVSADPTHIASSGNVVQNGTTTNVGGAMTPLVTIDPVTKTALVSAQGAGADFVLTPALVAQLNAAGVTTVTVDLGNTVTSYSVASLANPAITVANANNAVTGGWTVRTGPSAIATPTQQQRDYNLTDTAGPVDLGTANLIVNAARGTDFASGSTPSTVAAVNDAANTAAGFNAAQGSNVTLTQTRTASVDVRDAYNVSVTSPGNLNVSYVKANNNASLLAGTVSSGNLNINGPVNVGADLIGVGGKDVTIASGAAVAANGKVTLVADETAGTSSGPGWFINRGSIASGSRQVAIYGVSGVAPDGYTAPASQVILGNIDGLSAGTAVDNWATAYDNTSNGALYAAGTGKFNGVQVWYKAPLTKVAAAKPDAGPAVPQTTDTVSNTERDWHVRDAEPPIISAGFSARADCGRGAYAGGGKFTQAGGVEYDIGVPTFMNTATRQFGVVRGARRSEAAAGAMNGDCAEGMVTAALHPERFTISADALFAFDKSSTSDMLAAGRAALERFAAGLRDAYESVTSITVTGYTDRLGSDSYNQRLSEARAETVRAYLAAHGVQAGKMKVLGLGKREPVTHDCPAGHTPEVIACLQPDRRVTIDVVGQKRGAGQAPVLKASEPAGGRDLELSSLD
ncbi:filamentous hemagglutinin N-terminal domain-containing protein [Burkholderia pyrrocinia]|uniref:filamentous hemagglutinin N-terminal domain-containing protein n=1 Tax=Burkholderia pyrrocinia TaxID=60550 RepID=UPI001BD15EF0|nr:filamentous hemagglutinin N-terminal domain-containing protein [Burkholderia pyrrocinia]QVN23346.1 filamentous hemagglutinin N-terminal domain-containing protein [Burkholderia pyrrocinia]